MTLEITILDGSFRSGYSPKKGFCDLEHTLQMAKRVKAAGMKLLLDFHYSDYWADPGKQFKPAAWRGLSFTEIEKSFMRLHQRSYPGIKRPGHTTRHGSNWQ